jgi:hypothetical protein
MLRILGGQRASCWGITRWGSAHFGQGRLPCFNSLDLTFQHRVIPRAVPSRRRLPGEREIATVPIRGCRWRTGHHGGPSNDLCAARGLRFANVTVTAARGQSTNIPSSAAASTARCHASPRLAPWPWIRFSPRLPSTCQTVRPDESVNTLTQRCQPERWRRSIESSGLG